MGCGAAHLPWAGGCRHGRDEWVPGRLRVNPIARQQRELPAVLAVGQNLSPPAWLDRPGEGAGGREGRRYSLDLGVLSEEA